MCQRRWRSCRARLVVGFRWLWLGGGRLRNDARDAGRWREDAGVPVLPADADARGIFVEHLLDHSYAARLRGPFGFDDDPVSDVNAHLRLALPRFSASPSQARGAHARGVAFHDCPCRYRLAYHAAGSDDGAVTDFDAGSDDAARADPDVVADQHIALARNLRLDRRARVERVVGSSHEYTRCEHAVFADHDATLAVAGPEAHVIANPCAVAERDPLSIFERSHRRKSHALAAGQQAALTDVCAVVPVDEPKQAHVGTRVERRTTEG